MFQENVEQGAVVDLGRPVTLWRVFYSGGHAKGTDRYRLQPSYHHFAHYFHVCRGIRGIVTAAVEFYGLFRMLMGIFMVYFVF